MRASRSSTAPQHSAVSPVVRAPSAERASPVLVLASHPSITSVLCGLVTRAGHAAAAPHDDEAVEQAVRRIRPRVAIIDFEHPGAASPRIARQLDRAGTRTVLCSTWQRSAEARRHAAAIQALFFTLPVADKDFGLLLRTALLL